MCPAQRACCNGRKPAFPKAKNKAKNGFRREKIPRTAAALGIPLEVTPGFEPGNQGFADPCLTTWLCHRCFYFIICSLNRNVHCFFKFSFPLRMPTRSCVGILSGAGNEARTRYLHLGKVALYQMSYARKWCPEPESNQRHGDFQSPALPTELSGQIFSAPHGAGGELQPQGDPRDGTPSRGRWRPGTGSNRRPLA